MHILFIPSWYPRTDTDFTGSFFREQAEAFVQAGHRVGVLAVRGVPVYRRDEVRDRVRGIQVSDEHGIQTYRWDRVLPFPKLPGANEGVLRRAWEELYRGYVAEHGTPDVLHAHSMFPGGVIAHELSKHTGVPFVITEHRPSSIDRLRGPWNGSHGMSAARAAAARVAVAAGFVAPLNEAYGLEGNDGWQYLPGLLSPQFERIDPRTVPEQPFTFGHVSHLDPGKRVSLLIEAFHDAFQGDTGVRLRIAGDSPHRAGLEGLAETLGVADQVDFVGAVPRAEIVAEFSRSHVFVLPSEAEAFGTVLWEAMACGLPLVSTATWAGKNAITPENGLVVPIDDRGELAGALLRIRRDFAEYDPRVVRDICVAHCGANTFVGLYLDLYRKAIAS